MKLIQGNIDISTYIVQICQQSRALQSKTAGAYEVEEIYKMLTDLLMNVVHARELLQNRSFENRIKSEAPAISQMLDSIFGVHK